MTRSLNANTTSIQYPATAATAAFGVGYTYNAVDARETMTDPTGTTRYDYDELGRLRAVRSPASPVLYGYDVADARCLFGKASTLTYPLVAAPVTSCHDQVGRLLQVFDWAGSETRYNYEYNGRLRTMTLPNTTRATYTYDDADRLRGVRHERLASAVALVEPGTATTAAVPAPGPPGVPGGRVAATPPFGTPGATPPPKTGRVRPPLPEDAPAELREQAATDPRLAAADVTAAAAGDFFIQTATLDGAGNRTAVAEPLTWGGSTAPTAYLLDAQHRLKEVTYPGGAKTSYGYWPNGDRTSVKAGATTMPYDYDGAGRLISTKNGTTTTSYKYDANGNQLERTVGRAKETFTYDGANRLVKVFSSSGTSLYTYDGDGKRVRAEVTGTIPRLNKYVWDVNRALPVVLDDWDGRYLYGAGATPLARVSEIPPVGQYRYLHADGLGSVRVATDASGTTVDACDYDAFGAGYAGDPPCLSGAAFAGQARDGETGYYHLRARSYDPGTGRFTQADPLGYAGGGNQYAYAANNPGTLADPSGLCPICVGAAVGGAVGAAAGLGGYALFHEGAWDWGNAGKVTLAGAAAGAVLGATLGFGLEATGIVGGTEGNIAAQRLVPGVGLQAHETAGGHTIARHIGRTDAQLLARLAQQPWIKGASTFSNRATAETAIASTLSSNSATINTWLQGGTRQLIVPGRFATSVGRHVAPGATSATNAFGVKVVLRLDQSLGLGYRIHTAYPEP